MRNIINHTFRRFAGSGNGTASATVVSSAPPYRQGSIPAKAYNRGLPVVHSQVYDVNGKACELGSAIAKGGEGVVYKLEDKPDVLVKLYSNDAGSSGIEQKINRILQFEKLKDEGSLAWPRLAVCDRHNKFIGFAMREIKGFSLHTFGNPILLQERLPSWTRKDTVLCCISLLERLQMLHGEKVYMGDINPGNFLFHPRKHSVGLIDCDSYQIDNSPSGLCRVGVQEFLAPELLNANWSRIVRRADQDAFSAYVMVFRMLMIGGHPYAHVNGFDPVENIRKGKCPLGQGSQCHMPKGPWYRIWSHLPFQTKSLFIQMFREGHTDHHQRPGLSDLEKALNEYAYRIGRGQFTDELIPQNVKSSKRYSTA